MRIDITSLCFGFKIEKDNDSGTPAWATSIGQAPKNICFVDTKIEGLAEFVYGMMYKSHSDFNNLNDHDVPGLDKREEPRGERERMMFSVFEDVYVNNMKLEGIYTITYEREDTASHKNRLHICYAKYLTYKGHSNKETLKEMATKLGCSEDACWFVTDISIRNQKDLHFTAVVVNSEHSMTYKNSKERKRAWETLLLDIGDPKYKEPNDFPTQLIFYGAPGTGKSDTIKRETTIDEIEGRVFRITFHPDSDYSSFVGCYKPAMKPSNKVYSAEELAVKLDEIKRSGVTYPCQKFAAQYWKSVKDLDSITIKQILTACGFTDSMTTEISKGVAIGQDYLDREDNKIVYTFIPQVFTNAYVKAWNTNELVYLIIEEINRGNCAQIFGDLFQLLDRDKYGFSKYSINADTDFGNYLEELLKNSHRIDFPDGVKEGKKLVLPNNLFIWATMNTSDQSLFPIDSAFKRRWEWKYIKIANGYEKDDNGNIVKDENGEKIKLNWKIATNGQDWWEFIQQINRIINNMTSSADKQLGYFFCQANEQKMITTENFVSKVVFYLWNDVFKDYGFEDDRLFTYKIKDGEKELEKDLTFPDFYDEDGNVEEFVVKQFIEHVMAWKDYDKK